MTTFFTEICLITGLSTLTAVVAVLAFLTVFVFLSVSTALPKWRFAWGWKNTSSLLLVAGAWLTVPASGKWVLAWGSPNWGVYGSSESLDAGGKKLGCSGSEFGVGLGWSSGSGSGWGLGTTG